MGIGMNFGVITQNDIATELASRGISVSAAPDSGEIVISPPGIEDTQETPEDQIVVLPRTEIDYPPYIPIYPPVVVSPEDVTEEIFPYPGETVGVEKKGLDKGLLILVGVTAFALMVLSKSKPPRSEPRSDRRRYYQRQRRRY